MPNYIIIDNDAQKTPYFKWTQSQKFECKNRIVEVKGRNYRLVEKKERLFSIFERISRFLYGVLQVTVTCGTALCSKNVRHLFYKNKENVRFAVPEDTPFIFEKNEIVYLKPELFFEKDTSIENDKGLNFALIKSNGKQKLIPVSHRISDIGFFTKKKYWTYKESALNALLKIAQRPLYSDETYDPKIALFLNSSDNSIISKNEFLKYILEKDENGSPRLFTVNHLCALEILKLIKANNMIIDLNETNSLGDTLFTFWAGKGHADITRFILELNPSVIEQAKGQKKSPLMRAILQGSQEEAHLLLEAMKNKGLALSTDELWGQRAFNNEHTFFNEEFVRLDADLKNKIFYIANLYGHNELINTLKTLGAGTPPLLAPGPSLLARNMDVITARDIIFTFLKDLKNHGLLITKEEFSKQSKDKFICKENDFGRIQGVKFIEKVVKGNGLKHIKVPKKIAVINEDTKELSFRIHAFNYSGTGLNEIEIVSNDELLKDDQLKIYAEYIQSVDRKISFEEALELMVVVEKVGYQDFCPQNYIIAKDGIYFIDTEFKDFRPLERRFDRIQNIQHLLEPKDVPRFLAEFEKSKRTYENLKPLMNKQAKGMIEMISDPYKLTLRPRSVFNFRLEEL